jgi:Protein of unknown function (DUF3237)
VTLNIDRRMALFGLAVGGSAAAVSAATVKPGPAASAAPALLPPSDRPTAPRAVLVYDALALLEQTIPHGKTPIGQRMRVPIIGGEFAGPNIKGRILSGGWDWQLIRGDGYMELMASYFMETDDKVLIQVTNRGLVHLLGPEGPVDYAMSTPTFEVPMGKYSWLNQHIFCGTVAPGPKETPSVRLAIYKMV